MGILDKFFGAFEPQSPLTEVESTESSRRPFPQFNAFRPFVIKELIRRKTSYPTPIKSPFVRFTSCKQDSIQKYAFFALGLHGFKQEDLNIFDQTYGNNRDIVGYAHELGTGNKKLISADQLTGAALPNIVTNEMSGSASGIQKQRNTLQKEATTIFAKGTHPIPGVTGVSLQRRSLGTPLIATVRWTCYNRAQLEFLRHHFMLAGGYVVLEWGQNFSDIAVDNTLNFSNVDGVKQELANCINEGRKRIIDNWVRPNKGNYDFMVGYTGNFTVDLDPQTNIYNCSTTIYSVGEQMWGLSSFLTTVNKESTDNSNASRKSTTFHEFFAQGKEFDVLVAKSVSHPEYVAPYRANWDKGGTENVTLPNGFSANGQDYRFVSWNFFVEVVIPELLSIIEDENTKTDLRRFLNFTKGNKEGWIGDNPELKSTDPETLIIVRTDLKNEKAFAGIGAFDEDPEGGGYRAKLSRGVWLNAHAIREAFVGTNNFQQAIYTLLSRMNNAVGNYWKLQMFYDEETNQYKVVDEAHTDNRNFPTLYKFNHGTNGELLNISFDSAFPPELITQMALFAKFKTEKYEDQQALLAKYPSIGTTSTFMFSLNWTNLEDILDTELQRRRTEGVQSPIASVDQSVRETTDKKSAATGTAAQRLVEPTTANQGLFTQVSNVANGNPLAATPPATTPVMLVRNSVKPLANVEADALKLAALPYRSAIETAAARYGVDENLIRGVISHESHFNPKAKGSVGEIGLMQVYPKCHLDTAAAIKGRAVEAEELYEPSFNILVGTAILKDALRSAKGDTEEGLSRYNRWGGRNADGTFKNQPYVNAVMRYYNMFRQANGDQPVVGLTTQPTGVPSPLPPPASAIPSTASVPTPQTVPTTSTVPTVASTDQAQQDAAKTDIINRFGDSIIKFIELSPSAMIGRITRSGHMNYPNRPNSFVAPFPTTTSISLDMVGIGGISVSDGFFVDKLPYIFEQYGCFQVTSVDEIIQPEGWTTRVSGYFKLVWMNGEGPVPIPVG